MELQSFNSTRDKILKWEDFARLQPQLELEVNHYFSHGVYARELLIPADTILTGEIHKFENLNVLVKGKIKVSIGDKIEIIEAPFIVVSPPGTKRIAHTITDCIWITIHGTHEKNIDKIKNLFIADSEKDWLEFSKQDDLQLELPWLG